jgi:hypothetical protein
VQSDVARRLVRLVPLLPAGLLAVSALGLRCQRLVHQDLHLEPLLRGDHQHVLDDPDDAGPHHDANYDIDYDAEPDHDANYDIDYNDDAIADANYNADHDVDHDVDYDVDHDSNTTSHQRNYAHFDHDFDHTIAANEHDNKRDDHAGAIKLNNHQLDN